MSQYTDDLHSLSHTKWNCKYHIVFAPKYRRKAFYDARRLEMGKILRDLCEWKGREHHRSGSMPGSHSYVGGDTTEDERVRFCWISEREEQSDHLREMGKCEVQI